MKLLMGMVITSTAVSLPVFAQEGGTDPSTMTCAEFVVLDTAGQTRAMASIEVAAAAAAASIDEGTGADPAADDAPAAAATTGTDRVGAPSSTAEAATPSSGDTGESNAVVAGDTAPGGGDLTAALLDTCSSVPDMRVTDAMMQIQAGDTGQPGRPSATEGGAGATQGSDSGG
ncbi:hypothetical protein [Rubellimicrobium arenae]|uniref:hypothetical protein n=1 Tax=Rubellimicrobium arenae TaxID=2817372 RepID=UPI001B304F2A|nr:hypothetical protein [Rubellimicrobium arenae]